MASVAQLVGASSHKSKGHGFDSWSGHMPKLWVWSPVRACTRGNTSVFSPSFLPSLPLSLKSISMSSGED